MEMTCHLNQASVQNNDGFIPGLLLGLLCTANGFMFHISGFNIRLCDIMFFILPCYGLLINNKNRYFYPKSIKNGLCMVFFVFLWLTISGFIHFSSYSEVYQDHFIKYYINKTIWIPIYAILYMEFSGKSFLYGVFYGISICALFNVVMILYEFNSIRGGVLPNYDFIKVIGLTMDEKKSMVINQDMIRPTGLMQDPNYTGGYSGIGVIFFDYLYHKYNKLRYLIYSVLCLIPMFLLFSRTGLFSIFLTFVISLLLHFMYRKRNYPILSPWIIILIVTGGLIILTYILSIDDSAYEMLINRILMNDSSAGVRTQYIDLYFYLASPFQILFGVGAAGDFLSVFWGTNEVWGPESSYLSLFIEQGLLFFLIYISCIIYVFFRLVKENVYFALILTYINLIGLSYNFLGDRAYFFLTACLILYAFSNRDRQATIVRR